jgi:hypothetical protein
MTKKKNSPVKKSLTREEELTLFLNYMITGKVENESHAQLLNRVAKRSASISEAAMTAKAQAIAIDNKLTQIMEVVQIQNIVLQKLGATEEMFAEAETEYNEDVKKVQEELLAEVEANKAAKEEPEADEAIEVGVEE